MTELRNLSLRSIGKELYYRFQHDEVPGLAAQLAYFFLLSLFPFLIFLITLIGYLPLSQEDVLGTISQYAPGETMDLIESTLVNIVNERNGGLLSFGVIATIWTASNGINSIMRALNRAYDVVENRSYIVSRAIAIFLTFAMIFVIIVSLLLPVFGKAIGTFIFSSFGLSSKFLTVWNASRWILSFGIMVIIFVCLYYAAPNKKLSLREVWVGALFATLGWQLVSLAFSYYVDNFGNFSATYGSLGGIIILMIWFYLSGFIIILGGEINAVIRYFRREGIK
ncbi:YihY/virulence factor BrkB family protein [Bacillus solimangrovi]|uniref:Ribonuclease n=1 Tax=Bacillus solimangrovi TaxID=1305675 RepID=A0A1E5LB78_9BACI|nr:YihY/virulence factor BrkB family protein [Bacillus solimangrovi]OEH91328.1 ribonuclease [Bacillus solimangrovi]